MKSIITQEQLARKFNVTRQAVSYALRGSPKVSAALREQILAEAKRLGYDPVANRNATSLASQRNGRPMTWSTVAIVAPQPHLMPLRSTTYFADILHGIEMEAAIRDIDLLWTGLRASGIPHLLRSRQVDGVISLLSRPQDNHQILSLGLPCVLLDHQLPGARCIVPDNTTGMTLLVDHLRERGHRRIGYVGLVPDNTSSSERLSAFEKAAGKPAAWRALLTGLDPGVATQACMDFKLGNNGTYPVSAIVCYNDFIAMEVISSLRAQGIRVPEDISVVGFDNIPEATTSGLTTIGFDRIAEGRMALRLAITNDEVEGGQADLTRIPVQLIKRESSTTVAR